MGLPKRRPPTNNNQDGGLVLPVNYRSPPFYGNWPDQTIGMGTKKKKFPKKKGKGLLVGKNSPFKNVPLLNILL